MRTASSRYGNHQTDEENPYWISFSDIMAGLLVIFVLAAVALILELTQKSNEWDETLKEIVKAEQVRNDLLQEIVRELNEQDIPVFLSENDTILRVPEDALTFDPGKFEFSKEEQRETALLIAKVLYESIAKGERRKYLDTVFVEGHTDASPYTKRSIKGNWGLSTFRAIELWETWEADMPEGKKLGMLKNNLGKNLFSVSGYAETRPSRCTNRDKNIEDLNECPDGVLPEAVSKQKNRRIDLRFTIKHPTLEELKAIRESKQL